MRNLLIIFLFAALFSACKNPDYSFTKITRHAIVEESATPPGDQAHTNSETNQTGNNNTNANFSSDANNIISDPENYEYALYTHRKHNRSDIILGHPNLLYGSYQYTYNGRKTNRLSVDIEKYEIERMADRGYSVKLPMVGARIRMDMMNCYGYLGTADVAYLGWRNENLWYARVMPQTLVPDLKQRLLKCVDYPDDKFTRDYLSNFVYFIAPASKNRREVINTKKPAWDFVDMIPHEWRKTANLSPTPSDKELENCIRDWVDSDGDGKIDVLTLCVVNEESVTESGGIWAYSRILRLVNGKWRQVWLAGYETKD